MGSIRLISLISAVVLLLSVIASCGGNETDPDAPIESEGYHEDMSLYIDVPDLKDIKVYDSEVEAERRGLCAGGPCGSGSV